MNKNWILLGSLAIAAVSAITIADLSTPQGVYTARPTELTNVNSIQGAWDIYYALKGDYTQEDWLRAKYESAAMQQDRTTIDWLDQGPDNVGGRTRAILVDRADINHVWAGSVSGGLFESFNRANEWQRVDEFESNLGVSSMCQTPDGTLYVATGHSQEQTGGSQNAYDSGHNGDGVWIKQTDGTFIQMPGTASFSSINEVVCDTLHNVVWIATASGLRKYDPVNGVQTVSAGLTAGACNALSISPDGTVIVAGMSGGKTNVSSNSGVSFTDESGSGAGEIEAGAGRVEYAISHEKGSGGMYHIYASCANTHLVGIWRSTDNGGTWSEIAPAGNGSPGSFSPFSHSTTSGQGTYDNIISVQRGNPDRIFLGGIDVYSWASTGNWTQVSQWFYAPTNPQYVHADNHEMFWDKQGRLYIGNDGGIAFSDDGGQTFVPANRGYNVTQFYAIGYSAHGDVIGGAQDNGSQANYHDNATYRSHDEVGGGDGFSAAISFINRNLLFHSVYNGSIQRSSDRGGNSFAFTPPQWAADCDPGGLESGCGQFFTNFKLWENPNDANSTDSINYIPQASYAAGATVQVPSQTSTKFISYVTPTSIVFDDTVYFNPGLTELDTIVTTAVPSSTYNLEVVDYSFVTGSHPISAGDSIYLVALDTTVAIISYTTINHYYGTNPLRPGKIVDMGNEDYITGVAWDTLRVEDPFQSWFAIGLGGSGTPSGVWMTRNALRLSAPADEWFKVADGIGEISTMEFSRDGNHLFIGTWTGSLYRLSGFGQVYSPKPADGVGYLKDTLIDWDEGHSATTLTSIGTFSAPVTGIAVEGDVDHVVITLGNFGGSDKVRESNNASGGAPTWTNIGSGLPAMPMYCVVIDRDFPNTIMVGGEFGTYLTETGGAGAGAWVNCSGNFGNVPVYDMGQNWRTYNEGCIKPGAIYIGTHGRGIWSTDAFLALPGQQDNLAPNKFIPDINVYPNPVNEMGNLAFDLTENSDVYIQIFNLNGQMVSEISKSNLAAGSNVITFETDALSKGTYIIRLTAGTMVETTKFIKH